MEGSSFPPSPGLSPVHLSTCMEELVRYTLASFLDGTLDLDLPFTRDYCAQLLQEDPHRHLSFADSVLQDNNCRLTSTGVPLYPLYKRLGWAIGRSISHETFMKGSEPMMGIAEVEHMKKKENDLKEVICYIGSEMINMFKEIEFELHVQEPFFTQLKAGLKTIEGRCAVGTYHRIAAGALLLINKSLLLCVEHVKWYSSFQEMLKKEDLSNILPGVETIEEGLQIYRKFYSEEKEKTNGVLAIFVSRPACQPSLSIAKLLSGLSYEGVGSLLGMVHTAGSISDALPPPRSALISSFMSPHRLEEEQTKIAESHQ